MVGHPSLLRNIPRWFPHPHAGRTYTVYHTGSDLPQTTVGFWLQFPIRPPPYLRLICAHTGWLVYTDHYLPVVTVLWFPVTVASNLAVGPWLVIYSCGDFVVDLIYALLLRYSYG